MKKVLLVLCLLVLSAGAGSVYVWMPAKTNPKAVDAIKSYAALQFSVHEDAVKILRTEKQDWDSICLGLNIKNYDCKKVKTSGYEATVDAGGYKTTYRSSDDGKIIRVVKK